MSCKLIFLFSTVLFLFNTNGFSQKKKNNQEFQVQVDNDLLTFKKKTSDRYYSFGFQFDYRKITNNDSKLFNLSSKYINELQKVVVNWSAGIEAYTSDLDRDVRLANGGLQTDRPYAGWSYLSNKITFVNNKTLYFTEMTLGFLGSLSGAEKLQDNFHNLIGSEEFKQWDNQIENELAVNIGVGINHPIFRGKIFDVHSESNISLGTQSTFIKQGIVGRLGVFNSIDNTTFYHTNLTHNDESVKNEFFIDFGVNIVLWGYKSTIEGRLIGENRNINTGGINRVVLNAFSGVYLVRGKSTFFFKHHLITPETKRSNHFYYGSLGLIFRF